MAFTILSKGFVVIANELLRKCGNRGKISQIQECGDAYFANIYKGLLGDDLKGNLSSKTKQTKNLSFVQLSKQL